MQNNSVDSCMDQIRPLFFEDWIDTLPPEKFRFPASNCRPTFDSTSWNRRVAVNNWYGEPESSHPGCDRDRSVGLCLELLNSYARNAALRNDAQINPNRIRPGS
jgi:hypothetical protein